MLEEVDPQVAAWMEQERLSGRAKGVTETLKLAGVDLADRLEQFEWAWRRRGMPSVMTIWAEDILAVDDRRWLVAEPLGLGTRRSGKPWKAVEKPRDERRSQILRECFRTKAPLLGVVQTNRWSSRELIHEDQTSHVSVRLRDSTPWHVVQLGTDNVAVLVRGEQPWIPTPSQVEAARSRWRREHVLQTASPKTAPPAGLGEPFLAVNIGWMRRYQGASLDDPIAADNFAYFTRHGHALSEAHEQWNFADTDGDVYAYVPRSSSIAIERLGAQPGADAVDGVLVAFVARDPAEDELKVVGWYRNATVNRKEVYSHMRGELKVGSSIRAAAEDAFVLPVADRTIVIPTAQSTPGGVGQSPLWYATEHPAKVAEIRAMVASYAAGGRVVSGKSSGGGRPRQPDVATRLAVEAASMQLALAYFDDAVDVSSKAKGWDVEARDHLGELMIEVKGLSGQTVSVELTPNEYEKMNALRDRYVLFVVTRALTQNPLARVFRYHASTGRWRTAAGELLALTELVAARAQIGSNTSSAAS